MHSPFRVSLVGALLASLSFTSCSKEQDAVPATPTTTTSSNVTDPNYIGGPKVIAYGEQATYSYIHRGNGGTWDLELGTGFTVVSVTNYYGRSYVVIQAPSYDSQASLEFVTPDAYYGGGRVIEAGPVTVY